MLFPFNSWVCLLPECSLPSVLCLSQLAFSSQSSITSLLYSPPRQTLGGTEELEEEEQRWVNLFHMESKNGISIVFPQPQLLF